VEVPPVPWRRIAIGSVVVLAALGGLAAILVPVIESGKDKEARRTRTERAAAVRRETKRLRADQRPHFGRTAPAGPRPTRADRLRMVAALEAGITRDARARVKAGTLDGPIQRSECERGYGGRVDPRTGRAIYKCIAVGSETVGQRNLPLVVGYPFVATVDFERGRFCWCKTNPVAGEKSGRALAHLRPSRLCAGPLRPVL
jgi:hypothetical protein